MNEEMYHFSAYNMKGHKFDDRIFVYHMSHFIFKVIQYIAVDNKLFKFSIKYTISILFHNQSHSFIDCRYH